MAKHTCLVCGTVYDTAADCCPTCGNPLALDNCPEVPEAPALPEVPEVPEIPAGPTAPAVPADGPKPRRGRTWLWVLLVALVLLAGGGVAAWFLLRPAGGSGAGADMPCDSDSLVVETNDDVVAEPVEDPLPDSVAAADSAEYAWDDPAEAPAPEPGNQDKDEPKAKPEQKPKDNARHLSGTVTLPDGSVHSLSMTLRINADNDLTGSVTISGMGTSEVTGTYFPGQQRMMVYDVWGGIFNGQYAGSLYMGSYTRNDQRGAFECRSH